MRRQSSIPEEGWALIEREKARDRLVRRIAIASWAAAIAILVLVATAAFAEMLPVIRAGMTSWHHFIYAVPNGAKPIVATVLNVTLLVAAVSTIALILRDRAANLTEIQLRLAALEEIITSGDRS